MCDVPTCMDKSSFKGKGEGRGGETKREIGGREKKNCDIPMSSLVQLL